MIINNYKKGYKMQLIS